MKDPSYPKLDSELERQLDKISPSFDRDLAYKPCLVHLDTDNKVVDRVYVINAEDYIKHWGVWPENDRGKNYINISRVIKIAESPSRLPAEIANEIYQAGESGMGYSVFTLKFTDGTSKAYVTGNAVDFIDYPEGKSADDILSVEPHVGRERAVQSRTRYFWCLYSK
ncbi:hypothetical protein [Fodinibius salsisoli]|uniref:Uncharacterized protein n=1 Tax=Fodinibius salsisoli TaxID=2820877 RepID=A0ABT3PNJ7_9BACT|nr:hypothetical protein [Fodinibius salsisoli]MCW9707425.1 hypothetical protein [Fodinibius salsisoli]